MTTCTLCGLPAEESPVRDDAIDGEFCCRGCLEVYQLVDDADGPADPTTTPTESTASFEPATAEDGLETAYLSVDGMHCTTCETYLETTATKTPGIRDAAVSYATEMIRLAYDPDVVDREELPAAVSGAGYRAAEPGEDGEERDRSTLERYRTALAVILAMPVMAPYLLFIYPTYLGIYPESFLYGSTIRMMVFVPLTVWSSLIVLGIGYPIFRSAAVSLAVRRPNVDLLVAIAVLAAYGYSVAAFLLGERHLYFDVAVMILVVVTVGNRIESKVKRRAVGTHADLAAARDETVRVLEDGGSISEVSRTECEGGDRVLVNAGDRIPFDGTVVDGSATVEEALVTGESIPRSASVGEDVIGGSTVVDGSLVVEVDDDASSTLDRLVELLWEVQSTDAGAQRLVTAFAVAFVPLIVGVAAIATAGWLAAGRPPESALLIGLSVLVVSCPCSLGIATPLALAAGSDRAARNRTVVLSPNVLERITDSEIVVFDKTGTLTTGEMTVESTVADDAETVLEQAAAVEARSNHPIADAIVAAAGGPPDRTVEAFERERRSVSALVDGRRVRVGNPSAFRSSGWVLPDRFAEAIESARERGLHPTVVGWDGVVRGVVAIRAERRERWAEVVDELSAEDRRIVVLTGDDERATRWLRDHPNVDEVFADVRPESKEAIVRRLRAEGTTTMIGDGTNDAPALARADMGIALEGGTDLAMDAADVVVLDDDLEAIPTVFSISRSTRRRIRQNLGWALGYNAVAIPLAVLGYINPLIAAVLMGLSSLLVVLNSGRDAR
ncbi:heavy metal translocating P-type ATPase [Natronococcus sp. JC468]|uniref:heavy metal translocating P-type ATPase n=1 Tax=Natronococcus sp. JC468 TaxID=1961921 RepID=UPI00143B5F00|nr:heavy metal translocating P-type ATPase [Natronococcus sp. JC468]NKE35976.1 heavy metal translocating P-type ATPase [Natronococcus sp. JC468]